jgi:hypothetical protein
VTVNEETVQVRLITGSAPLASGVCGHDRHVLYNLAVGYLRHRDDQTECAASVLDLRRDQEAESGE